MPTGFARKPKMCQSKLKLFSLVMISASELCHLFYMMRPSFSKVVHGRSSIHVKTQLRTYLSRKYEIILPQFSKFS